MRLLLSMCSLLLCASLAVRLSCLAVRFLLSLELISCFLLSLFFFRNCFRFHCYSKVCEFPSHGCIHFLLGFSTVPSLPFPSPCTVFASGVVRGSPLLLGSACFSADFSTWSKLFCGGCTPSSEVPHFTLTSIITTWVGYPQSVVTRVDTAFTLRLPC